MTERLGDELAHFVPCPLFLSVRRANPGCVPVMAVAAAVTMARWASHWLRFPS